MSNCYKTRTPVYGDTRYNKVYMTMNVRRVLIILSNEDPPYKSPAFFARFNVLDLNQVQLSSPKPKPVPAIVPQDRVIQLENPDSDEILVPDSDQY
jgi:hypothetical protein